MTEQEQTNTRLSSDAIAALYAITGGNVRELRTTPSRVHPRAEVIDRTRAESFLQKSHRSVLTIGSADAREENRA